MSGVGLYFTPEGAFLTPENEDMARQFATAKLIDNHRQEFEKLLHKNRKRIIDREMRKLEHMAQDKERK